MTLRAPFPWTPGPALLTSFTTAARIPHRAAVLLVRRGRWAVGVFDGPDLVVSKVDARQVQGRTAAGGWSQQRFARRRGHQTDAVVDARGRDGGPGAAAARRLGRRRCSPAATAAWSTTSWPTPAWRRLPRCAGSRHLDVGEPTKAVLLETPKQFRAVDVHIVEPGEPDGDFRYRK